MKYNPISNTNSDAFPFIQKLFSSIGTQAHAGDSQRRSHFGYEHFGVIQFHEH
jgi:hypothetical protein